MFPNLSDAKIIAVDTETRDPDLKKTGPGWVDGNGHIVGVSLAVEDRSWYLKPSDHMFRWLYDTLDRDVTVVFANANYDIGWLNHHGVQVGGDIKDIQIAAPLIDENQFSYSLDSLGEQYVGEKKDEAGLIEYAASQGIAEKDVKDRMWEFPHHIMEPYARQDAELTLKVWHKMEPILIRDGLMDVFQLEMDLVPVVIAMRMLGVRIDVDKATALKDTLLARFTKCLQRIEYNIGYGISVNSPKDLERAYKDLNISFTRHPTGNPCFDADWLEAQTDPLSKLVIEARQAKGAYTFLENSLLGKVKNGRLHCQFNQLKGDEYGTVSGRFSSSRPNLQQVPARDSDIGPLVRGLFIPEEGSRWGAFDYSQQEPRLVVHYASMLSLPGAKDAVQYYRTDPSPDYHQMVADIASITREDAKTINLGLSYGMGAKKLCKNLGLPREEGQAIIDKYHSRVPFVHALSDKCNHKAQVSGFIRTLYGRRCRFPRWEPQWYDRDKEDIIPVSRPEALELWPSRALKRAYTYIGMNRLIQGSAADQTKLAMRELWKQGMVPHLQIHDELDFSIENDEQTRIIKEAMVDIVKLEVPVVVDVDIGDSWGGAKYA